MTEQTKKYLTTADQIMSALSQGKTVYVEDDSDGPTLYKLVNGFICTIDGNGNVVFIGDGINTVAGYDTYLLEAPPFVMSVGKWTDDCGIERYVTKETDCDDRWISISANGVVLAFNNEGKARHNIHSGIQLVRKIGEW